MEIGNKFFGKSCEGGMGGMQLFHIPFGNISSKGVLEKAKMNGVFSDGII